MSTTRLALVAGLLAAGCGSAEKRSTSATQQGAGDDTAGAAAGSECGHQGDAEPSQLVGMTAAHNGIRCQVSRPSGEPLPPLSWSSALAEDAQRYADQLAKGGCQLKHAKTEHGENLFGGSGTNTVDHVVERWAREEQCFQYGIFPQSCSCTCGHYTQIVWAETERLGCGMASCADGGEVWVCRYDRSGNYAGTKPY